MKRPIFVRALSDGEREALLQRPTYNRTAPAVPCGKGRRAARRGSHVGRTHSTRDSTVRMADRIVVPEDGRIVEEGSHDGLRARGCTDADMDEKQASRYP